MAASARGSYLAVRTKLSDPIVSILVRLGATDVLSMLSTVRSMPTDHFQIRILFFGRTIAPPIRARPRLQYHSVLIQVSALHQH